jgi:hypothetical protein
MCAKVIPSVRISVELAQLQHSSDDHQNQVECIIYNGRMKCQGADEHGNPEKQAHTLVAFDQRSK